MRVEKINENKIKVLIGSSEAKELNITEKMIAYNTPEVQRMFRRAIAIAEESANFYIDGAKLFVDTRTESVCLLPKYVPNKSLRRR